MEGFGLLIGHLIGDFIFQNDWMAKNKTYADPTPAEYAGQGGPYLTPLELTVWIRQRSRRAHLACTVHCLLYTLAVWLCSYWWLPWWGAVVCFLAHWPIDRFRLAKWWMIRVSGQKDFATGGLAPWSVIVVDNTFHLLTLWILGRVAL